ncbi:unnamed protein product, partial [Ceratitis capitata]
MPIGQIGVEHEKRWRCTTHDEARKRRQSNEQRTRVALYNSEMNVANERRHITEWTSSVRELPEKSLAMTNTRCGAIIDVYSLLPRQAGSSVFRKLEWSNMG